jgi:hypothetical protein
MPPGLAREVFRKPCPQPGGQGGRFVMMQVKTDVRTCKFYDKHRLKIIRQEAIVFHNESKNWKN